MIYLSTTNEQGFIYYFGIFYLKIGKFYTFFQFQNRPRKIPAPHCHSVLFKHIHVLAILKHADKRWEDLNEEYRKSPYLALDTHFMDEHLFNSATKLEEVQNDEFENIINVMKRMERED